MSLLPELIGLSVGCVQLALQIFPEIKRMVNHKKKLKELIDKCCQQLDSAEEILNLLDDSRSIPRSLELILEDLCSYRDILLEYQTFTSYRDVREREDELFRILHYIIELVNSLRVLTGVMEYVSEIFETCREVMVIHTSSNYRQRNSYRRNSMSSNASAFRSSAVANDQNISVFPGGMMRKDFQMIKDKFNLNYSFGDMCLWMGNLCKEGVGVKKSFKQSFLFYKYASNLQNPSGFLNMGWCYVNGVGVQKDYGKAIESYESGALLGDPRSMLNLADLYVNGIGVEYNPEKALRLLDKISSMEDSALCKIDMFHIKFFKAHVHLRHLEGRGNENKEHIGFYMLKDLEYSNDANVLNELGVCYCQGRGVNVDLEESYRYFKMAASGDSFWGLINLSIAYLYGLGTTRSKSNFRYYLEKAREHEGRNSVGIKRLKPEVLKWGSDGIGFIYENGIGVKQNISKAVLFYQTAAEYGNIEGILHIARLFEKGKGVSMNTEIALKYYRRAAEDNCAFAKAKVKQLTERRF